MTPGPEPYEGQWPQWASKRCRRGAQNEKDRKMPGRVRERDGGRKGTPRSTCHTSRSNGRQPWRGHGESHPQGWC